MPKVELEHEQLNQVQTILKQWAPKAEVWAYGSRVNGQCHSASDLDLVIRNQPFLENPCKNLSQIKQAFQDSHLPILVDVMDWAYLPEAYRLEIEKLYVVVQHPEDGVG